ncbi:flavodoxin domain-containing protein [Oceanivirga miroungae]|uniref:Flavodoxin n=1 Tax=Oceanivirga miroungae TaxID=1130046 RepID=A0A6I8M9W1_9FUSO|nr:flavodoxin domain-containing protein [Oceanivirga miroungae]VWL85097.1 flavodoxin [Oceanivirga miroungae]
MKKAIFYGTTTNTTNEVASILSDITGIDDVYNVIDGIDNILNYDLIYVLTPTYGRGELQDDWALVIEKIEKLDFSSKYVALLGTGDIIVHGDSFVNTLRAMYEVFKKANAKIVGMVDTKGYDFLESSSIENGKFLGLPIDHLNEYDLTEERIENWQKIIQKEVDLNE